MGFKCAFRSAGVHPRLGTVFIVAGLALGASGFLEFRRFGTTHDPAHIQRASRLVTSGVFGYTRNPMYLGIATILARLGDRNSRGRGLRSAPSCSRFISIVSRSGRKNARCGPGSAMSMQPIADACGAGFELSAGPRDAACENSPAAANRPRRPDRRGGRGSRATCSRRLPPCAGTRRRRRHRSPLL